MNQSLWLNESIKIGNKYVHNTDWENNGILYLNDILDENCNLINHKKLKLKYNCASSYLFTLQIQASIPKTWKEILKTHKTKPKNTRRGNNITVNNKYIPINEVTSKDLYWHIINKEKHIKWSFTYPNFTKADTSVWPRIFNLPFKTVRNTKIQTFQYRLIHRIIPCNKWLNNIKIKDSPACDFCDKIDDLPHFFLQCPEVKLFWKYWFNWWERISEIYIRNNPNMPELILFGFPGTIDIIHVLNFCILYTKYYIYIQRLYNKNKLDLYTCLVQLKYALKIEHDICLNQNSEKNFEKFNIIYDNI